MHLRTTSLILLFALLQLCKMPSLLLTIFGGLVVTFAFLYCLMHSTQHADEPPVLESTMPFLSPMIGMRKKEKFYISLQYALCNATLKNDLFRLLRAL